MDFISLYLTPLSLILTVVTLLFNSHYNHISEYMVVR